ncbi:MAG TPA: sigma-70 family RNA polymerase sigma factor [Kofleriaceae bacterium]|nr:sigma-70 family RNA polymerase sigma factor [Kofleriaceae bacterium]
MFDALFRIEYPKLIAGLVRIVRDVATAEELAQDALVAAMETWPRDGVPEKPGAWLMTTARNKALDRVRRNARFPQQALVVEPEAPPVALDLLSLILVSCHPVLPMDQRVALTLRLLGGLTSAEIARAFVVPEATIQQRITRAKQALHGVPFEVTRELGERLDAVLEVVYLIFNEGYSSVRSELVGDALRLGRMLEGVAPEVAEVHGLVALMELQASRIPARTAADGSLVLLADQDRRRWDVAAIGRGRAALAKAEALAAAAAPGTSRGVYALQAAIAECHTRDTTDWIRIAALYAALQQRAPSPIVELNRAVAVAHAFGPAAGLALLDDAANVRALAGYHLLPAVRGDLLAKLGRTREARKEFERAAALAPTDKDRQLMVARAAALT